MLSNLLLSFAILADAQTSNSPNELYILLIIAAAIVVCAVISPLFPFWRQFGKKIKDFFSTHFSTHKFATNQTWEDALERTGFAYDPIQDIFVSRMNSWQRNFGYCRLYDEAAAPLSMIIDCEPIRFEYANKKWLIELWKGQYGMTTGGEVGVFNTDKTDLNIPRFFTGTFYNSARNEDILPIGFTLYKSGKPLFSRSKRHWWLTGFVLGEFSEPSDLRMEIKIQLKDSGMATAFTNALKNLGYSREEYFQNNNLVKILYQTPHSPQPISRTAVTDWASQQKNKLLCEQYQELTKNYDNTPDKLQYVQQKSPRLFRAILKMGRTKPLYGSYTKLHKQLIKNEKKS